MLIIRGKFPSSEDKIELCREKGNCSCFVGDFDTLHLQE